MSARRTDDDATTSTDVASVGAPNKCSSCDRVAGGGVDSPERDIPWVNMAAGWSGDKLWAGGWITGAGRDEARAVRQGGCSWMLHIS
jgi:hypothetical protein